MSNITIEYKGFTIRFFEDLDQWRVDDQERGANRAAMSLADVKAYLDGLIKRQQANGGRPPRYPVWVLHGRRLIPANVTSRASWGGYRWTAESLKERGRLVQDKSEAYARSGESAAVTKYNSMMQSIDDTYREAQDILKTIPIFQMPPEEVEK